ncbi:hypothetical protein DSO57_1026086 [Entomophthora muscae]|uniref:Uncharacterized protein n=1 Tax=Entomophthora muscae TaxID=34485 RepID=A0ACC2S417_9FUNG|nr:hypothetical protein DSO57_1026086 [Entomophthora muscae]
MQYPNLPLLALQAAAVLQGNTSQIILAVSPDSKGSPSNNMKFIFLVWTFCKLISYGQVNVNFKTTKPTPTEKSEDSIWYHFEPRCCHAPYVETARLLPIIHPKAPWLILGYTSVYYLLNHFTPFLGRFRLFGHLLHMLMIGIPVGSTLVKINLRALLHSIEERLPNEWIPDMVEYWREGQRISQVVCHTFILWRHSKNLCVNVVSPKFVTGGIWAIAVVCCAVYSEENLPCVCPHFEINHVLVAVPPEKACLQAGVVMWEHLQYFWYCHKPWWLWDGCPRVSGEAHEH